MLQQWVFRRIGGQGHGRVVVGGLTHRHSGYHARPRVQGVPTRQASSSATFAVFHVIPDEFVRLV